MKKRGFTHQSTGVQHMTSNEFEIELEGGAEDAGQLRLSALASELEAVRKALGGVDRSLTGERKPSVYYRVVRISNQSPMSLTLIPVGVNAEQRNGKRIFERFVADWSLVKQKKSPEDPSVLESFRNITATARKEHISRVTFRFGKQRIDLARDVEESVERLIAKETTVLRGTLTGRMDAINLHGKQKEFRIYPIAGPTSIVCRFPEELKEKAIQAIDHKTAVTGQLVYRGGAKYVSEVVVKKIETFEDDARLPTLQDLCGAAPDATGDLSPEEFIERLRDEEW